MIGLFCFLFELFSVEFLLFWLDGFRLVFLIIGFWLFIGEVGFVYVVNLIDSIVIDKGLR